MQKHDGDKRSIGRNQKDMKIGIHIGTTNPVSGGEFTFQQEICKSLIKVIPESGHQFVIFHGPNLHIETADIKNLQLVLIDNTLTKRIYYKLYRTFFNAVKFLLGSRFNEEKYVKTPTLDVKYIMDSNVDMIWYVGPFCSTMRIPYIMTVLDLQHRLQPYFPEISNNGVWNGREKVYSLELRRAAFVIVSTEVGKSEIEKYYQISRERIFVLPYAAPKREYKKDDAVLRKYNLQPGYLFYPAQFWPEKNHIGLLHAMHVLRDKWNISLKLVLVGSDRGNLAHIKDWTNRLGLTEQVQILGFIPHEDLMALYQHALALTMPTMVGPDNIPSLEAFALGCPVISSNINGFEEQLGDAALLVDPTKEEEIALAIKSVYEDKNLREKLIAKGSERIDRWSWDEYVRGFFGIADGFQPVRRTWNLWKDFE